MMAQSRMPTAQTASTGLRSHQLPGAYEVSGEMHLSNRAPASPVASGGDPDEGRMEASCLVGRSRRANLPKERVPRKGSHGLVENPRRPALDPHAAVGRPMTARK